MDKPIYLDYNGTTPHAPEVIDAMLPFLKTEFGNPSSDHWYGLGPKKAIAGARKMVADMLGCLPSEIVFTSGGTESNNHALKGIGGRTYPEKKHIITSNIEHPAVLEVCRFMNSNGFSLTVIPVNSEGVISVSDVVTAVQPDTAMISIMHANNEVGTIQPIAEIGEVARQHGILMHTDAAQSVGKIPVRVKDLNVDLLSVAGHKVYAPKGVGALYIRNGVENGVFCHGAGQESGLRAGTENVLEIMGLGKASELVSTTLDVQASWMQKMRDRLELGLMSGLDGVQCNGHRELRLPNTCSVSFYGLEANQIMEEVSPVIAISAGAACHSGDVRISHVLEAMKVQEEWAKGTLRLTTGRFTTAEEIDRAIEILVSAVKKLRR